MMQAVSDAFLNFNNVIINWTLTYIVLLIDRSFGLEDVHD